MKHLECSVAKPTTNFPQFNQHQRDFWPRPKPMFWLSSCIIRNSGLWRKALPRGPSPLGIRLRLCNLDSKSSQRGAMHGQLRAYQPCQTWVHIDDIDGLQVKHHSGLRNIYVCCPLVVCVVLQQVEFLTSRKRGPRANTTRHL